MVNPAEPPPSTDSSGATQADTPRCTVYFDGACPLCQREIALYQRNPAAGRLDWVDVSQTDAALPEGLDRDAALRRFHVRDASGQLRSGAAGFATLWAQLPGWRALGRWAGRPPLVWLLAGAYRAFLPLRPSLQGLVRRWERRRPR